MRKVAIVGASGYTGVELIRLLLQHPEIEISVVTSEQSAGKPLSTLFPSLRSRCDLMLEAVDPARIASRAEIVFTALPHQTAMEVIPSFLALGNKVVDLSADYRLRDAESYARWYGPHSSPELLSKAVYGLPEIRRESVAGSSLVANPGCYPTSIILGLMPLLKNGLVDLSSLIADSASGVSGAGRSAKVDSLYCEVNDSFKAYAVGGIHRHIPEIEQELSLLAGEPVTITFTPHLVPMDRGILSTLYALPVGKITVDEVLGLYADAYANEPFVRVLPKGELPSTGFVKGSNFCDIGIACDQRTGRIIIVTALDNLVKGAAGQAIQNMNILAGLPEECGLTGVALFP